MLKRNISFSLFIPFFRFSSIYPSHWSIIAAYTTYIHCINQYLSYNATKLNETFQLINQFFNWLNTAILFHIVFFCVLTFTYIENLNNTMTFVNSFLFLPLNTFELFSMHNSNINCTIFWEILSISFKVDF